MFCFLFLSNLEEESRKGGGGICKERARREANIKAKNNLGRGKKTTRLKEKHATRQGRAKWLPLIAARTGYIVFDMFNWIRITHRRRPNPEVYTCREPINDSRTVTFLSTAHTESTRCSNENSKPSSQNTMITQSLRLRGWRRSAGVVCILPPWVTMKPIWVVGSHALPFPAPYFTLKLLVPFALCPSTC